jgi:plasmid stabilization system protein ParE
MARLPVILAEEAEAEARAAFAWYFDRQPTVADRFEIAHTEAFETLAEGPERGPEVEQGVRRLLLPRFPYGLLYAVESGHVVVLAVMHLRRRPGYWRKRKP